MRVDVAVGMGEGFMGSTSNAHGDYGSLIGTNDLGSESRSFDRFDHGRNESQLQEIRPTFIAARVGRIRGKIEPRRPARRGIDEATRAVGDVPFNDDPVIAGALHEWLPIPNTPCERCGVEFGQTGECLAHLDSSGEQFERIFQQAFQ